MTAEVEFNYQKASNPGFIMSAGKLKK